MPHILRIDMLMKKWWLSRFSLIRGPDINIDRVSRRGDEVPLIGTPEFIDVPAHQIKAWRFLGYFLMVPILASPVMVVDPFVPEGGNGETSLAFSIVCGLVGTGLLIYSYRFSICSVRLGERITVNYSIRTMVYEWSTVEEVIIERRRGKLDGVRLEMFYLNIHMRNKFICINVARELISSITAIVKMNAPKGCKFSGEILQKWVGSS